jgi:hypothetical protein
MPIELDDAGCIYAATDMANGEVRLLVPRHLKLAVIELRLDDPDPESTDAAEHKLLRETMDEHVLTLP